VFLVLQEIDGTKAVCYGLVSRRKVKVRSSMSFINLLQPSTVKILMQ
jgi:hypothetical protein